jgi:hypothetical protein
MNEYPEEEAEENVDHGQLEEESDMEEKMAGTLHLQTLEPQERQ